MTFSAKKPQTHENLSSALQKTFHFIRKKHFSCFWAFTPKIAFSNIFLAEGEVFEHPWPSNLIICTKHRIGVLRSYKEVICAIKLIIVLNTELVFLGSYKEEILCN